MVWLQIDNNLADVPAPGVARSNLGLGDMAVQQPWDVNIYGGQIDLPLTGLSLLPGANVLPGAVLTLSNSDGSLAWRNPDHDAVVVDTVVTDRLQLLADVGAYGLLVRDPDGEVRSAALTQSFDEVADVSERQERVPSMSLLFNLRAAIENASMVAGSINTDVFLDRTRNLEDLSDVAAARNALGMNTRVDTEALATGDLRVNLANREQRLESALESAIFPYFDVADLDQEGIAGVRARYRKFRVHPVLTRDDTNPVSASVVTDMRTVLQSNIDTRLSTTLDEFKDPGTWEVAKNNLRQAGVRTVAFSGEYIDVANTPSNVSSFVNDAEYLSASANLSDLYDPAIARLALGLHVVARTGKFEDLDFGDTGLSTDDGGAIFTGGLRPDLNLSDLTSTGVARSNLGLFGMALQDPDDVYIAGGTVATEHLTVRSTFTLVPTADTTIPDTDLLSPHVFLCAASSQGEAMWANLPIADADTIEASLRPGLVPLTHDGLDTKDTRSNVAASVVAIRHAHQVSLSNVVDNAIHSVAMDQARQDPLVTITESRDAEARRRAHLRIAWSEDHGSFLAGDESWGVLTRLSFERDGTHHSLMHDIALQGSNVAFRALDQNTLEIAVPTFSADSAGVVPPAASESVLTDAGWVPRTDLISAALDGNNVTSVAATYPLAFSDAHGSTSLDFVAAPFDGLMVLGARDRGPTAWHHLLFDDFDDFHKYKRRDDASFNDFYGTLTQLVEGDDDTAVTLSAVYEVNRAELDATYAYASPDEIDAFVERVVAARQIDPEESVMEPGGASTITVREFDNLYVTFAHRTETRATLRDSYPTTWLMARYARGNYHALSNVVNEEVGAMSAFAHSNATEVGVLRTRVGVAEQQITTATSTAQSSSELSSALLLLVQSLQDEIDELRTRVSTLENSNNTNSSNTTDYNTTTSN